MVSPEKPRVGAVGALVSSLTVWVVTLEMLPTLSWAIHLTVVVPSVVMLKLAVAPATVVAVPLEAGSLPSVVYVMLATPEPPSEALTATLIGLVVYQPAEQAALLQLMLLVGAEPSLWVVKLVAVLERPALFCAVTLPLWVPAVLS